MTTGSDLDLRQLPEFEPGPGLWSRIEAAQRAQVRKRYWKNGRLAAAAAAVVVAAILLLPRPVQVIAPDMLAGQRESQALESQWQQLAGNSTPAPAGTTHLRVIDAALQSAYDRGAQSDELVPLWQQRNQALRGLIAGFQSNGVRSALAITRI